MSLEFNQEFDTSPMISPTFAPMIFFAVARIVLSPPSNSQAVQDLPSACLWQPEQADFLSASTVAKLPFVSTTFAVVIIMFYLRAQKNVK